MTRAEVKKFLNDGVDALNLWFGRGRITEFNSDVAVKLPAVWQETKPAESDVTDIQGIINNWEVALHIAKKDKEDSSAEQYEDIIDECDEVAQKLIVQYNQIISGYKLVVISSFKRDPFVKKHASCLTGVVLSFTLTDPDKTNYCP